MVSKREICGSMDCSYRPRILRPEGLALPPPSSPFAAAACFWGFVEGRGVGLDVVSAAVFVFGSSCAGPLSIFTGWEKAAFAWGAAEAAAGFGTAGSPVRR
jgi:hypothetical protein